MIYVFVLCILLVLSFFSTTKVGLQNSHSFIILNKFILFFALFICFYLCAFRYKTGADYFEYMKIFNESLAPLNTNIEPGFLFLNRTVKNFYGNFWTLQIIISTFCCYFIYTSISKNVLLPAVSFLFYFMNHFFNGEMAQTRQLLAIAVLILGTRKIEKVSLVQWIFIVFIASQFHITAMFAFPLYWTSKIIIKTRAAFLLLFVYILINFFGLNLINSMLQFLSLPFFSFLPKRIIDLIYVYTNLQQYGKQENYNSGIGFLITIAIYIIIFILYHNSSKEVKRKSFLLNFLIVAIFNGMGRNFDQFVRFGYYYSICGFGISAYGLLFCKNSFYKKIEWLQPCVNAIIIAFFVLSFIKLFYLPINGITLIDSYLPWKDFITESAL